MSVESFEYSTNPQAEQVPRGHFLKILGLKEDEIAYNPAGPLQTLNPSTGLITELLPIRVESRNSVLASKESDGAYDPRVELVQKVEEYTWRVVDDQEWNLTETLQKLKGLEDPSVAIIHDEIILSGVRATFSDIGKVKIVTEVYAGKSIHNMELIAEIYGKDNRFCQLPDGRILFAFRPQGEEAGRGRMAFTIIKDIRDLRRSRFHNVPILKDQMPGEWWGGANELQVIYANGHTEVGVLGHIANMGNDGKRNYYPMVFTILNADEVDKEVPETTPIKIIAKADYLPQTEAKAPDLTNVGFPGALKVRPDGLADLFMGKNDYRVGVLIIKNPFTK